MKAHSIYSFASGIFCSTLCLRDSSLSLCISVPIYQYTTECYSFSCWWAFGLFPVFGCSEQSSCEYSCTSSLCKHMLSLLLGKYPTWMFNSVRNCQTVFQNGSTVPIPISNMREPHVSLSPCRQLVLIFHCGRVSGCASSSSTSLWCHFSFSWCLMVLSIFGYASRLSVYPLW